MDMKKKLLTSCIFMFSVVAMPKKISSLKNNIDLVAIFTSNAKHHSSVKRPPFNRNIHLKKITFCFNFEKKIYINVQLSNKMCCLFSNWSFFLLKQIILIPLKIVIFLGSALFVAYLTVILCAVCSNDGYDWMMETCSIN